METDFSGIQKQNITFFIQEDEFENATCKMMVTASVC